MNPRWLARLLAAAILVAVPSATAAAQIQDVYRGTVRSSLDSTLATLEWFVFGRKDTIATGWMRIGKPLADSGMAYGFVRTGDSLVILSASASGDSIVWFSNTIKGSLGGRYKVIAGSSAGQVGEWQLSPQPVTSRSLLICGAIAIGLLVTGLLAYIADRSSKRWWLRRSMTPLPALSLLQEDEWRAISGWLAVFVVSCVVSCALLLARLGSVGESLGTNAWMFGPVIPEFRPVLFVESISHVVNVAGIILGLTLTLRRSKSTPLFWLLFLVTMGAYALFDIIAGGDLAFQMRRTMGDEMGRAFERGAQSALSTNARLLLFSVIWSGYWARSKRVRVRFAPIDGVGAGATIVESGAKEGVLRMGAETQL